MKELQIKKTFLRQEFFLEKNLLINYFFHVYFSTSAGGKKSENMVLYSQFDAIFIVDVSLCVSDLLKMFNCETFSTASLVSCVISIYQNCIQILEISFHWNIILEEVASYMCKRLVRRVFF